MYTCMHCICNTQKEKSRRRRRVVAPVCSRCQTLWRLGVLQATPIFSLSHLPFRTVLPPLVCYFLSPRTATSATPRRVLTLCLFFSSLFVLSHTRDVSRSPPSKRGWDGRSMDSPSVLVRFPRSFVITIHVGGITSIHHVRSFRPQGRRVKFNSRCYHDTRLPSSLIVHALRLCCPRVNLVITLLTLAFLLWTV